MVFELLSNVYKYIILCRCFSLQKEHIETLAKLNFVLALVECIVECASPKRPRYERLVLLVRALQLLSSSLSIATSELKAGRLQPSTNVKNGKNQQSQFYLPIYLFSLFIFSGTAVKRNFS